MNNVIDCDGKPEPMDSNLLRTSTAATLLEVLGFREEEVVRRIRPERRLANFRRCGAARRRGKPSLRVHALDELGHGQRVAAIGAFLGSFDLEQKPGNGILRHEIRVGRGRREQARHSYRGSAARSRE